MNINEINVLVADGTKAVGQFVRSTMKDYFPEFRVTVVSTGKNIRDRLTGEKKRKLSSLLSSVKYVPV